MTINQSIDKILSKYKDIEKFPDIKTLKDKLFKLKTKHGGNAIVDNCDVIAAIIKSGSANPDNWN